MGEPQGFFDSVQKVIRGAHVKDGIPLRTPDLTATSADTYTLRHAWVRSVARV